MRDVSRGGRYIEISGHGSIIYTLADLRGNAITLMKPNPAIYHSQSRAGASGFLKTVYAIDLREQEELGGGERLAGSITCRLSCQAFGGGGEAGREAELRRREPSALARRL